MKNKLNKKESFLCERNLGKKMNKKGMEKETLAGLIFFVIILILILLAIMIFTDKGKSALDFIKNLFRFGA